MRRLDDLLCVVNKIGEWENWGIGKIVVVGWGWGDGGLEVKNGIGGKGGEGLGD